MNKRVMLLLGVAALPACLYAQETGDSILSAREKEFELNEVVVAGNRAVLKVIYMMKEPLHYMSVHRKISLTILFTYMF